MTQWPPLHLTPRLVAKPWGGRRLAELGRELPDRATIGESWDVADLPAEATSVADPVTRVACGPHAGRTLGELIAAAPESLLGAAAPSAAGRFPLLLKHLDAQEHLSVQVHPPADVLATLPGACLKAESWVVVAAAPGAELFLGVAEDVTLADVRAVAGTPDIVPLLRRVPARPGDVHHLPAGLLHCLGAGVVVAEPQTPSDTTYRLYDWAREHERAPRPLHVEESLTCLAAAWGHNVRPPAPQPGDGVLVDTAHYRLSRYSSRQGRRLAVPRRDTARVVVVVTGELSGPELARPLGRGGVTLLPAVWSGDVEAAPGTTWLDVDLVPAAG